MLDAQRLRKVAILVDSLDAERADSLLEQMPEKQRAMIRNLVVALDNISDDERENVIVEFLGPKESPDSAKDESNSNVGQELNHHSQARELSADAAMDPFAANESFVSPSHQESRNEASSQEASPVDENEATTGSHAQHGSPVDDVWLETSFPYNDWTSDTGVESERMTSRSQERSMQVDEFQESRIRHWEKHQEVTIGSPKVESQSEDTAESTNESGISTASRLPFSFLKDEDAERVARFIECEQPQMIARVVSCLRPKLAASVVTHLVEPVRRDVLSRIPNMQDSDTGVLSELERYVLSRLTADAGADDYDLDAPGFKSLEAILEAASEDERNRMIGSLRRERPELDGYLRFRYPEASCDSRNTQVDANHESVERQPGFHRESEWSIERESNPVPKSVQSIDARVNQLEAQRVQEFDVLSVPSSAEESEDNAALRIVATDDPVDERPEPIEPVSLDALSRLDDRSFAKLLGEVDASVVLIALAGAEPKLLNGLLRLIPKKDAKQVKRRIEQIGPIRLKDIERAQQELARRALELIGQDVNEDKNQALHLHAA